MININKLNQNNNYTLGKPNIKTVWSNLQWNKTLQSSGDMGLLIPIDIKEMLPSEKYTVTYNPTVQFTPFVTNLLHEVTGEIYSGFVPNRLTMDRWQEFITGTNEEGEIVNDGDITIPKITAKKVFTMIGKGANPRTEIDLTEWKEVDTNYNTKSDAYKLLVTQVLTAWINEDLVNVTGLENLTAQEAQDFYTNFQNYHKIKITGNKKRYLKSIAILDYLEYPIQITGPWDTIFMAIWGRKNGQIAQEGAGRITLSNKIFNRNDTYEEITSIGEKLIQNWIIDLPIRAYNKFYNDWVRYFDWEPKRELTDCNIAKGKWAYDMYTRARRYQLRGAMPTVPVNIPELNHTILTQTGEGHWISQGATASLTNNYIENPNAISAQGGVSTIKSGETQKTGDPRIFVANNDKITNITLAPHGENGQAEGSFNLFDFLTAGAIMNYYCNNAKIKPRYGEQLWARWGVSIQDARLQLAEFVNSQYFQITQNGIVQTSAQTSADSTLQGNITGQMWGNGSVKTTYNAQEHGYLVTIMLIKPKNSYERGVNPLLQKVTKWDFATPELANLPDRPIYKKEIAPLSNKDEILGYKSIYDEYRTDINTVTGILRPSLNAGLGAHTLARLLPANVTMQELVECNPDVNRIKQFTEQPDFIFSIQKQIIDRLPLPYETRPELNM